MLERIARNIKEIGKDARAVGKRLWPVLAPFTLIGALSFSKLNADTGVKQEKQDYSILWAGLPDTNGDGVVNESDYFDMRVDEFESYLQKTMSIPSLPDSPPPEINQGDMVNPYKEPNDRELKYGRGDVNGDGKRDTLDYQLMVDGDISDASDVDMDGKFTQADIDSFFEYINGEKEYLDSEFNKLKTPDERKQWYDRALLLDGIDDTIKPRQGGTPDERWECMNYSYGTYKAIYGFMKWDSADGDEHVKYGFIENGKLNGPVHMAVEYNPTTRLGHSLNVGWIGRTDSLGDFIDDPTDINNWLRIEPSDNTTTRWSDLTFPPDMGVKIYTAWKFVPGEDSSDIPYFYNTITFESDSTGNVSVTGNQDLIKQRPEWINTLPDALPPEVAITYPKRDSTYNENISQLEYILSDENPDTTWYSTDEGKPRIYYSGDSPITGLQSSEGENTWVLYHKDWVGNMSSDTVKFNVNTSVNAIERTSNPLEYSLGAYPNPVNTSATIKYTLPITGDVSMILYDIKGREVKTLVNETQPSGPYTTDFSTDNLSSGMYIIRLRSGEFNDTEKITVLK